MVKQMIAKSDLKKVTKTCDVEKARRTRAIRVVTPPLRTAGPGSTRLKVQHIFHRLICHRQYIIIIMGKPIAVTEMPALSAEDPEDAR